jgi:hypothetical protein
MLAYPCTQRCVGSAHVFMSFSRGREFPKNTAHMNILQAMSTYACDSTQIFEDFLAHWHVKSADSCTSRLMRQVACVHFPAVALLHRELYAYIYTMYTHACMYTCSIQHMHAYTYTRVCEYAHTHAHTRHTGYLDEEILGQQWFCVCGDDSDIDDQRHIERMVGLKFVVCVFVCACVCACVRVCVRACVFVCVCVCVCVYPCV